MTKVIPTPIITMSGIYVIRTEHCVEHDMMVYVIGRSVDVKRRLELYGSKSELLCYYEVDGEMQEQCERDILNILKAKYKQSTDFADNYFEDDIDSIKDTVDGYFVGTIKPPIIVDEFIDINTKIKNGIEKAACIIKKTLMDSPYYICARCKIPYQSKEKYDKHLLSGCSKSSACICGCSFKNEMDLNDHIYNYCILRTTRTALDYDGLSELVRSDITALVHQISKLNHITSTYKSQLMSLQIDYDELDKANDKLIEDAMNK